MSIRGMLLRANHSVTVQTPVRATTAMGGKSAADFATGPALKPVWVQPASDKTKYQYLQRRANVTHTVFLDQDPVAVAGLTVNCRLLFGKRILKVRGFRNVAELGRLWVIDCEE